LISEEIIRRKINEKQRKYEDDEEHIIDERENLEYLKRMQEIIPIRKKVLHLVLETYSSKWKINHETLNETETRHKAFNGNQY
jgi:hypothetical protein